MRILAMKNKMYEFLASKTILENDYAPDDLSFLIEVIQDTKQRNRKDNAEELDNPELFTIKNISERFGGRTVFVDFFRADLSKYKVDAEKVSLVIEMNSQLAQYKKRILSVMSFPGLIPVISAKRGVANFSSDDLEELIKAIRIIDPDRPIAIRMDSLDSASYDAILQSIMTDTDYFIFDANETDPRSLVMQFDRLKNMSLVAQKILLCSPRKRDIPNGEYEHRDYTTLIDNSALTCYSNYGFEGYGDYGGLRDDLPRNFRRKEPRGCALALVYNGTKQRFKSYLCNDSSLRQAGFMRFAPEIIDDRDEFDPFHEGYIFDDIEQILKEQRTLSYQKWICYTLIQYVQQMQYE